MSKVFAELGMSLDGFIAGPNARPGNPLGDGGPRIHQWAYGLATWRERVGMTGGAVNADNELVEESYARTGAYVMGRRMFDEGEVGWPENAPFRVPVFVATGHARDPWVRPGGTTFVFVTDGAEKTLEHAKEAAGDKDVRVAGGASVVVQLLNAGLVDELHIHLAPVLLGEGIRLLDGLDTERVRLEQTRVIGSATVTHLGFRVTAA